MSDEHDQATEPVVQNSDPILTATADSFADQSTPADQSPMPGPTIDEDGIDELVQVVYEADDAALQEIRAIEKNLVQVIRDATHTASLKALDRCRVALEALLSKLNELRYRAVFLPIVNNISPGLVTPVREADARHFVGRYFIPQRHSYRGGGTEYDDTLYPWSTLYPRWVAPAEQEAMRRAYAAPNPVREQSSAVHMCCQDATVLIGKLRTLAFKNERDRKRKS